MFVTSLIFFVVAFYRRLLEFVVLYLACHRRHCRRSQLLLSLLTSPKLSILPLPLTSLLLPVVPLLLSSLLPSSIALIVVVVADVVVHCAAAIVIVIIDVVACHVVAIIVVVVARRVVSSLSTMARRLHIGNNNSDEVWKISTLQRKVKQKK